MKTKMLIGVLLALIGAGAAAAEEKQIELQLDVPDSAWKIAIDSVYQVKNELWVVATVSRNPDAMGAQVISTLKASVKVNADAALPVKYFVIGKTWGWKGEEAVTYLQDLKDIEKDLLAGQKLYESAKAAPAAADKAPQPPRLGGYSAVAVTDSSVIAAADFARAAQEKVMQKDTPSAKLALVKIVDAQQQVVSGMNYRMTLKVKVNDAEKDAEAVVWWQAWNKQEPYKLTSWTWK